MAAQLRNLIEDMQAEANKWLESPNNFAQGVIVVDWLRKLLELEKGLAEPAVKPSLILGEAPRQLAPKIVDEAYFQDDPNDTRLVTIVDGPLAGTLVPVACHMPNGAFIVIDNTNYRLDGAALHCQKA